MKRLLLICSLVYPLSAQAMPIQLSAQECKMVLDTLRNQIETIFLAEVTLAQLPRRTANVDAALRQVREQLSDALDHHESSVTRRGAGILGEKCLGDFTAPATD